MKLEYLWVSDFKNLSYESSRRDTTKDTFSIKRSQRIDWIKTALQDPSSEMYVGWDRKKKHYNFIYHNK